jgi:hypothetical protein
MVMDNHLAAGSVLVAMAKTTVARAESSRLARLTEGLLLLAQFDSVVDAEADRSHLGPTDLRTLLPHRPYVPDVVVWQ